MTSHRSRPIWRRILIVSLQALAAQGAARATCGSATCFIDTSGGEGLPLPSTVRVDLSFRYVDQDRKLAGTREVAEVLTPKVNFEQRVLEPDHHREVRTQNSLIQLDMLYGVSRRAGVLASVPLFTEKDHEHFDDVGTPDEHFTSGDGTRGFGDLQLGAIYALVLRPKDLVQCGLKIKLPTGAWKLHDSEGAINEPTIQPGSGSTDILADLHYSHLAGPARFDWFVSGSFRANGENGLDYRAGDESVLNVGVDRPAGESSVWSLQLNARHTERDRFLGRTVPSTGATYISLSPGIRFRTSSGGSSFLYVFVQMPAYQKVNESQLAPRWGLVTGVTRVF